MGRTLLNVFLFQVGWFACVISGAMERPWIGAVIATFVVAIHLLRAHEREAELKLVLIAVGIGAVCRARVQSSEPHRREHRQDDYHGSQDGYACRQNSLHGVEQRIQGRRDPPRHRGSIEKAIPGRQNCSVYRYA